MSALLPCPFCGGKAPVQSDALNPMDYVECNDCGAMCDLQQDEPAAMAAWNLRASGWQEKGTEPGSGRVLAGRFAPHGEWVDAVVNVPLVYPFTHWQPLPAAPAPQEPDR